MLFKEEQFELQERANLRGGDGVCLFRHVLPGVMVPHCRMSAEMVLKKGCSVGEHQHDGEAEIYYCLKGEGVLYDNGEAKAFKAGDCHICPSGSKHSLVNEKEETLVALAIIITE